MVGSRKQKSSVLIAACTPGRAYRSWGGPSSSCRSGCSWSRPHLCHLCLMSPVFLSLKGSAPVICACPCQDQVILALQHTRTALWAACCLSLEMDATAECCRTQHLRVKSGASKALPCCSSLVLQRAHQTALMLQLSEGDVWEDSSRGLKPELTISPAGQHQPCPLHWLGSAWEGSSRGAGELPAGT